MLWRTSLPANAERNYRSTQQLACGSMRQVASDVVFIHGAGMAGPDAWPEQSAEHDGSWFFLPRQGLADEARRDARRVIDQLRSTGVGHVVAHSYGANAALLAAQHEPDLIASLVLLEPACFDLARGQIAVEEHIAALTPVFDVKDDPTVDAREFSRLFARGMGFDPPDLTADELGDRVSRLRAMSPPWGLGITDVHPQTLVVTGGGRPLYEQTAMSLTKLGARHRILEGAAHRVQDDPRATQLLRDWFSEQR
jgi:pimeloyl-ACP methyl ester carboxylesterase